MCIMANFGYFTIIFLAAFTVVDVAMVTIDDDNSNMSNMAYKTTNTMRLTDDEDLTYSDMESLMERQERFYRKLKEFGVPSDVVNQMYPARGLTLGELLGHGDKSHHEHSSGDDVTDENSSAIDPWTIVWYIGSFGGLVAFFLIVSCSEWCCLRNRSNQQRQRQNHQQQGGACPEGVDRVQATARPESCETPPPSYHLFAPPSYDSIGYGEKTEKYDIFVVPVHAVAPNSMPARSGSGVGEQVPPPEYSTITMPT